MVDPAQVDQVLANLCANARDAIRGNGHITIGTGNVTLEERLCSTHAGFVPGDYVLMSVNDDGTGMDTEVLEHLFEPYFTTKGVGKGTGLGLSTVYGIVKQNRGFVDVDSGPGKGTAFRIYLPRAADAAVDTRSAVLPAIPKGHGETVLLVEDDAAILEAGKKMLERLGYGVLCAGAPAQAVSLAQGPGTIDLLITDVVMPLMNGRDLATRVSKIRPSTRVLFVSGYTEDVIAHRGILDQGVHFLQKPFSLQDLGTTVRKILDSK